MRPEVLEAIERVETELSIAFPESVKAFLGEADHSEVQLGNEAWFFLICSEEPDPEHVVSETTAFRDEWQLGGVVIAHNGLGDQLVLLPTDGSTVLSDMLYVMLHETAQIREMASSLQDAAESDESLDYIYGDAYEYRLNEDGTVEAFDVDAYIAGLGREKGS